MGNTGARILCERRLTVDGRAWQRACMTASDSGIPGSGGAGDPLPPDTFLRTVVAPSFARQIDALRAQIAGLENEVQERAEAVGSVRIDIEGDGGGTWYLNVGGGHMEVAEAPVDTVLFSVSQTVTDWHALASRGTLLGVPQGDARTAPAVGRGAITRTRISRLRAVRGTVRLVLREEEGAERAVTLHFGDGSPAPTPQTIVTMREGDARRLRDGSLDPQAAFLQGLVGIAGDMALAMQLGAALFL